ncbi:PepSY-associated TM helix domain-containing protein [Pseudomonas sp. 5P_3.1_Bac2]|uniref:PepSY-associated TM helix domain-containing protein n=1 Tax=Pseudomonas sp. 5P_3.1_Bac2 TaxID=2971617 RepID=UPI0021C90BE8|nr:PepSY-associated TM helix domain-containing protein [Pseudomonas sp. 5P_3.1_Bac2]MCU1716741.1 PepSY domain-containing protein [Pseudomonas sp. 5P_3.1_Bac2]
MKHSITQSLSWLHTWAGLIFGWALVAIFFTGTLAVFDKEIQQWLQPEVPVHAVDQQQAAATAISYLQATHPQQSNWQVSLPTERWPRLAVSAGEAQGGGGGGRGNAMTSLDPVTGEVIKPRESAGGNFFFRFHYTLHFPRNIGVWVVGFLAMAMLAAIVSGIVIHKKFFKEFFTFRPNKGQRSWLDYHNASGVLLLPFHIMITYTGLVIFFLIYMPAPMEALFDGDRQAYQAAMRGEPAGAGPRAEAGAERPARGGEQGRPEQGTERAMTRGAEQAEGRGARPGREQEPRQHLHDRTAEMNFPALLAKAEAELGPLSGFRLQRSPSGEAVFEARPVLGNIIELTKGRSLSLDALTGKVVKPVAESTGAGWVQRVMAGLHFAQFGGYPMRWLYFLCGMISTAMMAAGLLLFTVKRRRRYAKESLAARFGYQFIERVNIAIVAGLPLASIALLWANRLLPVDLAGRAAHEINAFFAVWGLSFLHASLRPWAKAWPEQLWLAGALAIGLPLANGFTGLPVLGNASSLYLELTCMAMGALTLLAGWRAAQPQAVVTGKARKAKTPATSEVDDDAQESPAC